MPLEVAQDVSILVVDDDPVSLALVSLMLEAEGYPVIQAAGGEQALTRAAEAPPGSEPSVVLADLQMPGLCGAELALALRAVLPRATLVAMSATKANFEGYDAFVSKPFDAAEFRERIGAKSVQEPERSVARDLPALNERTYRKLQRMMPPAGLADIFDVCLKDARRRAVQMKAIGVLDEQGMIALRRSAHAIKGGAGMVGASKLANAASRLERGGYQSGDLAGLIHNLLECCDELEGILKAKQSVLQEKVQISTDQG